jgi:hypothetical protein
MITTTDNAYCIIKPDRTVSDLVVANGGGDTITDVIDAIKNSSAGCPSDHWLSLAVVSVYDNCGTVPAIRRLKRSERKLIRKDPDAAAQQLGLDLIVYDANDAAFTAHLSVQPTTEKEAA